MSYKIAEHLGVYKIRDVFDALNEGKSLDFVASILGVSVSRASRIVSSLFQWKVELRPWTEEYLERESQAALNRSEDCKSQLKQMRAKILPFGKANTKNRA